MSAGDAAAYAALKERLAPGLATLRGIATARDADALGATVLAALFDGAATVALAIRALEVAAAQLAEESHPTEFTPTSRAAARRTVEEALATLRYGGGEESAS